MANELLSIVLIWNELLVLVEGGVRIPEIENFNDVNLATWVGKAPVINIV
jgi:hypothetical protein